MKKFQDMLYKMALNEDNILSPQDAREASDLYEASRNMSDDELAIFVADNDDKLRSVLGISESFPDEFKKEYNNLYIQGKSAFVDEGEKLRGSGKQKSLDEYMKAFRLTPNEGGFTNVERSSFTDPKSIYYWGKYPKDKIDEAAITMGYGDVEDMKRDLTQQSVELQHTNSMEGYNPDGTINVGGWLISAAEGLVLPRVKEAQLAGREVDPKDVAGDLLELGFNFVPGVGFFNKSGKLVARMAGGAIESLSVPVLTNTYDLFAYGNDDMNPRGNMNASDFLQRVGAQSAGVAAGKGLLMGVGSTLKNYVETQAGGAAGDITKRGTKLFVDELGQKTDAIIAKRQAMLDRKAELAKQKQYLPDNMGQPSQASLKSGYGIDVENPSDIIAADNYRILTEHAKDLAERKSSGLNYTNLGDIDQNNLNKYLIAKTDDGQFVRMDNGDFAANGDKWTPNNSEVTYKKPNYNTVDADIDVEGNLVRYDENAIRKAIEQYPELKQIIESGKYYNIKEILRDALAHAVGNTAVREGVLGQLAELDNKREIAMWNKGVRKYRDFVNANNVSPELKKRYINAFVNIKYYGLDSLPQEIYNLDPEVYKNAAKMMGIEGWPHEVPDQPTTSNSTRKF